MGEGENGFVGKGFYFWSDRNTLNQGRAGAYTALGMYLMPLNYLL